MRAPLTCDLELSRRLRAIGARYVLIHPLARWRVAKQVPKAVYRRTRRAAIAEGEPVVWHLDPETGEVT